MSEKDTLALQGAGENTDELTRRLDAALAQLDAADTDEVIRLAGGEARSIPELDALVGEVQRSSELGPQELERAKERLLEWLRSLTNDVPPRREPTLPVLDNELLRAPEEGENLFFDRTEVTGITFLASLDGVPGYAGDFSKAKNGSVMAWIEDTQLFIAGEGGVALDEDASGLFADMFRLRTVRCSGCVDTSAVTDMSYMFFCCSMLTQADVAGWDTSAVIDMSYMFYECRGLTALDVAAWELSSAENLCWMFGRCSGITALDVAAWDVSNVYDMSRMFGGCEALAEVDVSGWDTANAHTDEMFLGTRFENS